MAMVTQEEGRVRRPELHHPTLLRLPRGGRVADVVILVHERVEVFEVLDPMTCIEVGLRQQSILRKGCGSVETFGENCIGGREEGSPGWPCPRG